MNATLYTCAIAGLSAAGVVLRPFRLPEAIWAVAGALVLLALGLVTPQQFSTGVARGSDVYLFLTGMMLLSELARREGLFDWIAAIATARAKGSPHRLFLLVYGIGTIVTVLLSNDATAVVLTPAVYAACRAARVKDPLPYLLICAFIANAASFVLPISNPANLVIFAGGEMPALSRWLQTFLLPSCVAVVATFVALYWTQKKALDADSVAADVDRPELTFAAKLSGWGLLLTAVILVACSALHVDLGLPTFVAGVLTTAAVLMITRQNPIGILKGVSWAVLPLVAGLFVIVEAINQRGITGSLAAWLGDVAARSEAHAIMVSGLLTGFGSNLVNNLPMGLFAGSAVQGAHVSDAVAGAALIGVDLGPNLSITGSLATILWLACLRREGIDMRALDFLRLGVIVMLPALFLSLACLLLAR